MSTTTTNYGLIKPVDADNADLKIFVGQNMDTIDTELAKRISKDPNGSYTNPTNSSFAVTATTDLNNTAGAITKLVFQTVQYDTLSEYDLTNNRFVAKQAGIYMFSACFRLNSSTANVAFLAFYKNGSADARVQNFQNGASSNPQHCHGCVTMKLNANDYVECYMYSSLATTVQSRTSITGYDVTFFRGIKLA